MFGEMLRFIKAGSRRLLLHRAGGGVQRDKQRNLRSFPFQRSPQVPYVRHADVAAFDLDDNALGATAVVVEEIDIAVNAPVSAATTLSANRQSVYQAQSPELELIAAIVFALSRQCPRAGQVFRVADYFVGAQVVAKPRLQTVAHQADGEVGDVNPDPAAVEAFGHYGRCAAAAERVQDEVAFVAAGADDAVQQRFRLLSRITETFRRTRAQRRDVRPDVLYRHARHFVQVAFVARHRAGA